MKNTPLTALSAALLSLTLTTPTALAAPNLPRAAASTPQPSPPERAVWPLTPRPEVVRGFDLPSKPWLPGHRGLDLTGSPGQPVRSATSGTITYAGPLAGRGVVVVTRGPIRTTYEPVIPSVTPGTTIQPGDPLGHLSAVASHCPPATCLHWGLLQGTTYLNPLSLLPTHPIRLLPHTNNPPELTGTPPRVGDNPPQPAASTARPGIPTPSPGSPRPPAEHPATHPSTPPSPTPGLAPGSAPPRGPTNDAGQPTAPSALPNPAAAQFPIDLLTDGDLTAGAVVVLAALITIASALMTKRH